MIIGTFNTKSQPPACPRMPGIPPPAVTLALPPFARTPLPFVVALPAVVVALQASAHEEAAESAKGISTFTLPAPFPALPALAPPHETAPSARRA